MLPALATAGSAAAATADTAGAAVAHAVAASKTFGFFAMFVPSEEAFPYVVTANESLTANTGISGIDTTF